MEYRWGPWLADGSWHRLKIEYTPQQRKPDKSKETIDAPDFFVTYDGKKTNLTGKFSPFANGLVDDDHPYMYWEMTAATGASASTQAIAFKEIPKTSGVDHTATITKDGRSIIDGEDYESVYTDDVLSYESKTLYATGDVDFQNPVYTQTIHENLDYVEDSFEVKEDGASDFRKVSADEYTVENGMLTYKLKKI